MSNVDNLNEAMDKFAKQQGYENWDALERKQKEHEAKGNEIVSKAKKLTITENGETFTWDIKQFTVTPDNVIFEVTRIDDGGNLFGNTITCGLAIWGSVGRHGEFVSLGGTIIKFE